MVFPPHGGPVAIPPSLHDQPQTAMHGHAFAELVIVTGGTGMHAVENLRYPLSPGDIFVISGRRRHAYYDVQKLRLINVVIHSDFMKSHRKELVQSSGGKRLLGDAFQRSRSLSPEELGVCLRIIERIKQELARFQDGSILMQKALLLELLVTVSRLAENPATAEDLRMVSIGKALSLLELHYAEDIGLSQMARAACMSLRSFQRHFKNTTGVSPTQYLRRHRIASCCRLLRETNASVQSIAADCGIPDPIYFCRLFRRMTGTTPGAFRRFHARER